MWKEFREFAMKGNVMDLAVGVIIGGTFKTLEEAEKAGVATIKYGLFLIILLIL